MNDIALPKDIVATDLARGDWLGPAKVVHLRDPEAGLAAVVVVDNVAAGPAIGGVRMAPDVSVNECRRLARAMTLKNAAAGLGPGGGKSVVAADPAMARADKERVMRAFAVAIRGLGEYIPGPDMGTDEGCMSWLHDEIARAVGLPAEFGGIPLDVLGATGFGLAIAAEVAAGYADIDLNGARLAVQGFGSVGRHAARFLAERGAVLVAAADSRATVQDADGLDVPALIALKEQGGSLADYGGGQAEPSDAVIHADCDIWIPAARPDVIDAANAASLRARLVLEGANIPIAPGTERTLHQRGVLVVPDFIANAGGVICAAVEYAHGTETSAFQAIADKVRGNVKAVLERSHSLGVAPRDAAVELAQERVRRAMGYRRFGRGTPASVIP